MSGWLRGAEIGGALVKTATEAAAEFVDFPEVVSARCLVDGPSVEDVALSASLAPKLSLSPLGVGGGSSLVWMRLQIRNLKCCDIAGSGSMIKNLRVIQILKAKQQNEYCTIYVYFKEQNCGSGRDCPHPDGD